MLIINELEEAVYEEKSMVVGSDLVFCGRNTIFHSQQYFRDHVQ